MIQLADARRIIAAAEKKATEIGQPMNIAVADAGGNLISHVRMDNAWIGSIDISIKKAWTLARLRHRHQRHCPSLPIRQPVLRHPRLQRRQSHDLRRRHSSQERRQGSRSHRGQRRLRRSGPRRSRSRRIGFLIPQKEKSPAGPRGFFSTSNIFLLRKHRITPGRLFIRQNPVLRALRTLHRGMVHPLLVALVPFIRSRLVFDRLMRRTRCTLR